jgi:signal transduction histidine kinase
VTVRHGEEGVELEVVSAGAAARSPGHGGHGLTGMRERARLSGGTLEAGPDPGGGFRVRASLPVQESPA